MRRTAQALSLLLVLSAAPPNAAGGAPAELQAGLEVYFRGRFDQAAVHLKRSFAEASKPGDPGLAGVNAYFLARSFAELGLRGLALHYLGEAEHSGSRQWQAIARREIARTYFQVAEYPSVMKVYREIPGGEEDPEIFYLAGIAAAMLENWGEAAQILSRIPPSDRLHPFARLARAQAAAAAGDNSAALGDLEALIAGREEAPAALRDQAQILRGKILFLEERPHDARAAFAAVKSGGALGYEALRGLLLTGADPRTASKAETSAARPAETATLLRVKALAAEERNDTTAARALRHEIRQLVKRRMELLEQLLGAGKNAETSLGADLAGFAERLHQVRWASHCPNELALLPPDLASALPAAARPESEPFSPREATFYSVWDQARLDPWLRGLIELLSRSEALERDLQAAREPRPFWAFWRSDEQGLLALALLEVRALNLRQLLQDHLKLFRPIGDEEFQRRKSKSIERALARLRRLYLGEGVKIPRELSNLEKTLEYKQSDMLRLVASVPERSTDPVISLLGNAVDLLGELRPKLRKSGVSVAKVEAQRREIVGELISEGSVLRSELGREIHRTIVPTLRRQMAFFTRLEADNEGSLSRLYTRDGKTGERGEHP